jgi:hypothetical protein
MAADADPFIIRADIFPLLQQLHGHLKLYIKCQLGTTRLLTITPTSFRVCEITENVQRVPALWECENPLWILLSSKEDEISTGLWVMQTNSGGSAWSAVTGATLSMLFDILSTLRQKMLMPSEARSYQRSYLGAWYIYFLILTQRTLCVGASRGSEIIILSVGRMKLYWLRSSMHSWLRPKPWRTDSNHLNKKNI